MNEPSRDSLEELEKKLYTPGQKVDFEAYRPKLTPSQGGPVSFDIPRNASQAKSEEESSPMTSPKQSAFSLATKLVIASVLFFVVSGALAAYLFLTGGNIGGANNIDISVNGPVSVRGGGLLSFLVQIKNDGAAIQSSDMTVTFPDGTRDPGDSSKLLPRFDASLGALSAGASVSQQVGAILYGDLNEEKTIEITYYYRPADSNSLFKKVKIYTISLSSAPVTISFNLPDQVDSNNTVVADLKVTSNNTDTLRNLVLDVSYPPGFQYLSSTREPVGTNHTWQLGNLAPGKTVQFQVTGIIQGQDGEQKSFKVAAGSARATGGTSVDVPYASISRILAIARPFLGLSLNTSGSAPDDVITDGSSLTGSLDISNNLSETLNNFHAEIKIGGKAINLGSVDVDRGFFRSSDNVLSWDASTDSTLGDLSSGDSVSLPFSFKTVSSSVPGQTDANRSVALDVTVTGTRLVPGSGRQTVTETQSKIIKISSLFSLAQRAVYSTGPFTNSGPIPPVANQKTTYTVIWSLSNSANALSGITVRAKLPSYITWLGAFSPSSEKVSYNSETREILWQLSDLPSRLGYGSPAREMAFQIAFTPSVSQQNAEPVLIPETDADATDNFTNADLTSIKRGLTTNIDTDPRFSAGSGVVK
jgi:hypothetical protein